jgi:hypothetical protein
VGLELLGRVIQEQPRDHQVALEEAEELALPVLRGLLVAQQQLAEQDWLFQLAAEVFSIQEEGLEEIREQQITVGQELEVTEQARGSEETE